MARSYPSLNVPERLTNDPRGDYRITVYARDLQVGDRIATGTVTHVSRVEHEAIGGGRRVVYVRRRRHGRPEYESAFGERTTVTAFRQDAESSPGMAGNDEPDERHNYEA